MKASAMYGTIIRYVMTAVIAIVAAMPSAAQEGNRHDDSISDLIIEGLKGTESFIENTLDSKDSEQYRRFYGSVWLQGCCRIYGEGEFFVDGRA